MIKNIHRVFIVKSVSGVAILIIWATIFFSSCKIYKPAYFFKDIKRDTIITGFINNDFELKIQKDDVLSISISSLNPAEDILFNKAGVEGKGGFQVSFDGNIYLHKLGKVMVAGLTRKELKLKLETMALPYLKDPIVTINFVNHRIIVLGEASSLVVDMPEEKISLMEVMARSGSFTPNSRLDKLMVIRESPNTKEVKHLNLEDPSIFTSPWYYLQPHDIVVVKPNEEKIDTDQKRTRNQILYTTILSAVTFVFFILDRIFR